MSQKGPQMSGQVLMTVEEYERQVARADRILYLTRNETKSQGFVSAMSKITLDIIAFNRQDKNEGLSEKKRQPVKVYLDYDYGHEDPEELAPMVEQSFYLCSAIELSETPVYTFNIGCWASAAFLVGIAGHMRYALPGTDFMMDTLLDHDCFSKELEQKIFYHIMTAHSLPVFAESFKLGEFYDMTAEDAKKYGFIDKLARSIDDIV